MAVRRSFFLPDGTQLREPFRIKAGEDIIILTEVALPFRGDFEVAARTALPSGFIFENQIQPYDKRYEFLGALNYADSVNQADLGITGLFSIYGSQVVRFAWLVRPLVTGEITLPQMTTQLTASPEIMATDGSTAKLTVFK